MPNNKWIADLKTTLQVAKARLDVREKKKTEQVAKERYTVADYIRNNKIARGRIAVEHLIREDYKIEAMDRIEAYVDILLMRLQLIKDRPKNGPIDPAIEQPLVNILWAAPFLAQDVPEFGQVTSMFKKYFGAEYVSWCENNKDSMVDTDVIRCLSCELIPKLLVEKYLIEICRTQNVPFEPDPIVMAQDEFWTIGQRYIQQPSNTDEKKPPPSGGASSASGGGDGGHLIASNTYSNQPSAPELEKPPPTYSSSRPQYPNINSGSSMPPPTPPSSNSPIIGFNVNNDKKPPIHNLFPQVPSAHDRWPPMVPPPPPMNDALDDPGFDDLARRFEELKKRK